MKRLKWIVLALVIGLLSNVFILYKLPVSLNPSTIQVKVDMESTTKGEYQFFYSDGIFVVEQCQTLAYNNANERQTLIFEIPTVYDAWRIDFGEHAANVKIYSITLNYFGSSVHIEDALLDNKNQLKNVVSMKQMDNYIDIEIEDGDPQCIFFYEDGFVKNQIAKAVEGWCNTLNIVICVVIDIALVGIILVRRRIFNMAKDLFVNRELILNLAKNDFKTKYVGSYLGIIWAFIQPVVTVLVYWFVFQVGLKSGDVGNIPFIIWLLAGLVPWFFFSDGLGAGTTSLMEYQYLVKKIVFNVSVLPIVKILSAMFVHVFFMVIVVIICAAYGYTPDLYTLQILYYSFCTVALVLALVYFTSAVVVFFRDTTQIISVFLQIGIWMTPIMWNVAILPAKFVWIFKMIPMYYIVAGYRESLIEKVWFWDKPYETVWFWSVTLILFTVGSVVFKKLKVHFADVL